MSATGSMRRSGGPLKSYPKASPRRLYIFFLDIGCNSTHIGQGRQSGAVCRQLDDMASGMFPSSMSEIMQGVLLKVYQWAARCGFGMNLTETELMLFTTKARVSEFHQSIYTDPLICSALVALNIRLAD